MCLRLFLGPRGVKAIRDELDRLGLSIPLVVIGEWRVKQEMEHDPEIMISFYHSKGGSIRVICFGRYTVARPTRFTLIGMRNLRSALRSFRRS
jgi:hypothetical protein